MFPTLGARINCTKRFLAQAYQSTVRRRCLSSFLMMCTLVDCEIIFVFSICKKGLDYIVHHCSLAINDVIKLMVLSYNWY